MVAGHRHLGNLAAGTGLASPLPARRPAAALVLAAVTPGPTLLAHVTVTCGSSISAGALRTSCPCSVRSLLPQRQSTWSLAPSGGRGSRGRARDGALAAVSGGGSAPTVVVVESPTKAKKIQGFLGDQYKVLASYGHVRDLPPRDGSVQPDAGFAMSWELHPGAGPRLAEIEAAAAGSPRLLLATDPDREGEAISWHIEQELRSRGVLQRVGSVQRITFTEITKSAITAAMAGGRQVSQPLVDAYLARRALDYLVGFHLSPVLWRKLPGAKSAGRVQSVALRLVCEREAAVERFSPTPYWSLTAALEPPPQPAAAGQQQGAHARGQAAAPAAAPPAFTARLTHVDGRRLGQLDISSAEQAEELARRIQSGPVVVTRVSRRRLQRHPSAPFTTSSLQQEASRRLGFGAARTMRLAQQLYEGAGTGEGLITYMRTDGVSMSAEAVEELRRANAAMYGAEAVPPQPRQYKSRAKNAQEAHEAIRPTRPAALPPSRLPASLDPDLAALYDLVWRRAVASQMSSAVYEVVTVELSADGGRLGLRASGSSLRQPGFLAAYADLAGAEEEEERQQGKGSESEEEEDGAAVVSRRENQGAAAAALLTLQEGTPLVSRSATPAAHATRPPPRFTEASLVRALEERGIGRPSTYAPIMSLLQDRGYVGREGRALLPTSLGRVLTAFLERYFGGVVDYGFTSDMEAQLDDVASGKAAWRLVLSAFWGPFHSAVGAMAAIRTTQVFDALDADLEFFLFPRRAALLPAAVACGAIDVTATTVTPPSLTSGPSSPSEASVGAPGAAAAADATAASSDPRVCPKCGKGRLVLKPSRFGGFIGCSLYADEQVRCDYGRPLLPVTAAEGGGVAGSASDSDGEGGPSPLGAVSAAATERLLGQHPDTGEPVYVKLGPYGLYVQQGEAVKEPAGGAKKAKKAKAKKGGKGKKADAGADASVEKEAEAAAEGAPAPGKPRRAAIPKAKGLTLHTVTLEAALGLLALPRTLGPHPEDGQPVVANTGPFGPYVAHGGVSASLGRRATPQEVELPLALELLSAKRARQADREAKGLPPRGGRRTTAKASKAKAGATAKTESKAKTAVKAKAARGKKAEAGEEEAGGAAAAGSEDDGKAAAKSGGYTAFMRQRWQAAKEADPGAAYREAVSRIAAEWRELGPEGQRRFSEEADTAAAAPATVEPGAEAGSESGGKAKTAAKAGKAAAGTSGGGRRKVAAAPAPAAGRKKAAAAAELEAAGAGGGGAATAAKPRSNPFMAFCTQQRPAVKAANPGASLGEVAKLLGAAWNALSYEQKAGYR